MVDPSLTAVVVDRDLAQAEKTATLVRFLGFGAETAGSHQQYCDLVEQVQAPFAVLVGVDEDYSLLRQVIDAASEAGFNHAFFLINDAEGNVQAPQALRAQILGMISLQAGYRELQGALHEAALAHRSSNGVHASARRPALARNLVGCSAEIHRVRELVSQVAATEASVLITGESGTGKEVVARSIHNLSERSDKPFVPVNCGAIPAELLESELFGHEKGAFTGAISARPGRFEVAEGGTLFLDEIGDMPLDMQVKLLRVLQERTFERVGSHRAITADVRIVAATHQNLEQLVAEGKFRMDLFYRLNVFPVEIPPLRARAADIPLLIDMYASKLEREQRGNLRLSDCAVACLSRHYWPGNVRELFNLMERLAILYPRKTVKWSDLPDKFRPNGEMFVDSVGSAVGESADLTAPVDPAVLPMDGIDLRPYLASIERNLMTQALTQSEWVVARAAKLLNLQRTTLVEKMRKFEIQRPEELTEF